MRIFFTIIILLFSLAVSAQEERDTILTRCPVYITDTVSSNNFFLEPQPATLKVYRERGNLTVVMVDKEINSLRCFLMTRN